jgi:hypothetical protein
MIRQRTPTLSYNTYPKGWAHSAVEGVSGSWIEGLLQFDLSACLPSNAVVADASLQVHVTDASNYSFEIREMLRPFSAYATWTRYSTWSQWTREGAMGAGSDYGARVASVETAPLGLLAIPLDTAVVQRWVGAPHASLVVRPTGVPGTNYAPKGLGFRSKEHVSGSPPVLKVAFRLPLTSAPSLFKIVSWNLQYGKGSTTKAGGLSCPLAGLKDNVQCQIADDPATAVDERADARRSSAWGTGLTQRYLNRFALGDPEVIALLLTEVNGGTCFTQADLMNVVRLVWPKAEISGAHRDNWIVARWGFAHGVANYAVADLPPCGYREQRSDGTLVRWPVSYREGIQWSRIYAEDPGPDEDPMSTARPRTLNVFNAHWPHRGLQSDGTPAFCLTNATITTTFMNVPAPGVTLADQPVVLGGDLNAEDLVRTHDVDCEPAGGRAGFDVLRNAGLTDAFSAAPSVITPTADGATGMLGREATHPCYRSYSHNGPYMPFKRIDYQWFRGGTATGADLRVISFELFGAEQFGNCVPSDHMGVKVQYQWY